MAAQKEYKVGGRGAVFIFITLFLLFVINQADRLLFSVALEPMKKALSLTDTQAGALVSAFLIGMALLTIPGSMMVERWSRRKSLGIMALIWSAATYITGLCSNFTQLFITRFTVGIGEAGYTAGGLTWLSLSFRKEIRSRIMGFFMAGLPLGNALGLIVGGIIITATQNWQSPFYIFAIPGIILGIVVFFLPDYKTLKAEGESSFSKKYFREWGSLLKIKTYWLAIIGQSLFQFLAVATVMWMSAALMRTYSMTAANAGLITGLAALGLVIASPLGGYIADKCQKRYKSGRPMFIAIGMVLYVTISIALAFALGGPLPVFVALIVLQWFFGAALVPVQMSLPTDVIIPRLRTTGFGILTFFTSLLGASAGTFAIGALSDLTGGGAAGLKTAFLLMCPAAFLSCIVYFIMTKFYYADSEKVNDLVVSER